MYFRLGYEISIFDQRSRETPTRNDPVPAKHAGAETLQFVGT